MALTGLQIFKHLPGGKKEKEANCKKCGFPTCMAFAMKLAKNEVSFDKCEYISDELKTMLLQASQKQQIEVCFGTKSEGCKIGNETVMFRHEKKFVNPACLAIKLKSSDVDFDKKFDSITSYSVERVGEVFKVDAIVIEDTDDTFVSKVINVSQSQRPLILVSDNAETIEKVLESVKDSRPMVFLKGTDLDVVIKIKNTYNVPVIFSADSVEALASANLQSEDIVLNLSSQNSCQIIENLTMMRRSAINDRFLPLGYPVITFIDDITGILDSVEFKTMIAGALMSKYSSVVVLDYFDEASVFSLLTLRQNIFTDPQKPLQIEAGVYPIGNVNENSPVIVTTNFALTYFSVANEVEASGVPSYIVITPSDGMSVLTAWAASKFTGEIIAKSFKQYNIENLVKHRKMIIPGYVASLKVEIMEDLPEWNVFIGTNEAVDIPKYLQNFDTL